MYRVLAFLLIPLVSVAGQSAQNQDPLANLQKTATQWALLRSEAVKAESDWATEKLLLESSVEALKSRIGEVKARVDQTSAKTAGERTEIAAAQKRNADAVAAIERAEKEFSSIRDGLNQFRSALPPRLSSALELPFRSINDPALPLGDRMQHLTSTLGRCLVFDRQVSFGEEPLGAGNAELRMVETLYWGLAIGYAYDKASHAAYQGQPVDGQWKWEPLQEGADAVAHLIAVYKEKADPKYIAVPATLAAATGSRTK